MKHKLHLTWTVSCFFLILALLAGTGHAYDSKALRKAVSALTTLAPETGAVIFDIQSGRTLYRLREHETFVPASVAKLVTSYAALKRLGPQYTFVTEVYAKGKLKDGNLHGDIYIKGYGDPFFVDEKTWLFAEKLYSRGLRHVTGNLVVDGSYFSPPVTRIDIDRKENRPYNAVLAALSVDFNTVTFRIFPPAVPGKSCIVSVLPESSYVELKNKLRVTPKCSYPRVTITRTRMKGGTGEIFTLAGVIPLKAQPFEIRSNVAFPLLFSGHALRSRLKAAGIRVDGSVRVGAVPADAKLLANYTSPPLKEILYGLNRFSNNFMAEMLFRALGAKVYGAPATVSKGKKVVETELQKIGLGPRDCIIVNGSGLSREMRVSPYAIRKILESAYRDFSISAEFLSSLATPGTPGTLKLRFSCSRSDLPVLRAKTGSMKGVVTLAGYVKGGNGRILGVVLLCNGVRKPSRVKKLMDKIVCLLRR